MTPEVAVVAAACVTATGAVIAAVASRFVVRAHQDTRAELRVNTAKTDQVLDQVLDQVANDHDSNLRMDLDQVQADVGRLGTLMARLMSRVEESLLHSREHEVGAALVLEGLELRDRMLAERLEKLEHPDQD